MKILITGSRNIRNKKWIYGILDAHVNAGDIIIHGGAIGVDLIAQEWCRENGIKSIVVYPVSVERSVNFLYRDTEMVGMSDTCIAFWNGTSKGTIFTYNYAKKRNKALEIFIEKK